MLVDAAQVFMPSLSPTMQRGTIVKWYKQEGELSFSQFVCFTLWFLLSLSANVYLVVSMQVQEVTIYSTTFRRECGFTHYLHCQSTVLVFCINFSEFGEENQ